MTTTSTLSGQRILITRASKQYPSTAALVQARGGIPISLPCLDIDYCPLDIPLLFSSPAAYSDVLLTSANGVESLAKACPNGLAHLLQGYRVAAVGKKTAQALKQHAVHVHVIPQIASQKGLLDAYQQQGLPTSLLFFRAQEGSDFLSQALQTQGIPVHTSIAYRTVCPQGDCSEVKQLLASQQVDAVLLASARTAQHYLQRIGDVHIANNATLIVISQQVADAADKLGLNVQLIANHPSFASMLDALEMHL